jgi:alpha-D-ribose 1-methylphosphonate 5-triphosphate synthase subunit PhnL
MNRKARRTFVSLMRRKKLRHLPPALFSAEEKQFVFINFRTHW